jgi:hypothetical protein
MMMRAVHGVPHPVGLATLCVIYRAVPSYWVIARANRACEWLVAWHRTVAVCPHVLQTMMTPHVGMSCRCLGNMWACIGNTRASLHVLCRQTFLYSHGPRRVMGRVPAQVPSCVKRCGPEPEDTWHHRSSPPRQGEIWDWGTCDSTRAFLGRETGSRAMGHAIALEPA